PHPARWPQQSTVAWASTFTANCQAHKDGRSHWSITACRRLTSCSEGLPAVSRSTQEKAGLWQSLKEISMYLQGRDEVHKTLRRVTKRLDKAGIPYAIVGGLAVKVHGYRRTTNDVDLLLTPQGLEEFRKRFVPKDYEQAGQRKRRFVDKVNQ